ncbi:LytTR family two component transcriptional regulator [Ruminococcaceae bacterium R-25]|nr:LytTR family two component transcriptional regulator [Ruminococcaceae bacterium R-25]SUQ21412.1 two component transcriptional regulator, LytTR family [Oscillospiraceae bacterium]
MLIAICDDNSADAEKIRFSLMDITQDLEMKCFSTGTELIESVKSGNNYSVLFQDVYLENESGIEVAKSVKELSPDTQVIFVTSSLDHAIDAFKVQATDYLVKPCSEADIVKAFARVSVKMNTKYSVPVVINTGKEIHVFHTEKVIKIESDRHYTVICCSNNRTERLLINFSYVAELFGNKFIEIRRGLLVNPGFIEKISGVNVILADGSSYILPKAKKDAVTAKYIEYITEKN